MKNTYEVSAEPGQELTIDDISRFIEQVRAHGAGALATRVKAKVRFNGTLRGLSIEVDDQPILGQRPRTDTGKFTNRMSDNDTDRMNAADDAWLAQQW